jgi:hypothetical protein
MYRADVSLSLAPETSVRTGARHRHSTCLRRVIVRTVTACLLIILRTRDMAISFDLFKAAE